MKKLIILFFDKWWITFIFTIICDSLFILSVFIDFERLESVSYTMLIVAFILLSVSTIYQFIKNRLVQGIISGVLLIITISAYNIYFLLSLVMSVIQPDNFADNLIIPDTIVVNYPENLTFDNDQRPDSILLLSRSETDFVLYNSFQPGLFEYDIWIGQTAPGIVFLKAFEISKNIQLSSERLKERSTIHVYNPSDSLVRFGTKTHFTIYEGDWGQPYGARFEVWYKPDKSKEEQKIIEKNYIIEGWMR